MGLLCLFGRAAALRPIGLGELSRHVVPGIATRVVCDRTAYYLQPQTQWQTKPRFSTLSRKSWVDIGANKKQRPALEASPGTHVCTTCHQNYVLAIYAFESIRRRRNTLAPYARLGCHEYYTNTRLASSRSPSSSNMSLPPALFPSSKPPCARTPKSSFPVAITESCLHVSRHSIVIATWFWRT